MIDETAHDSTSARAAAQAGTPDRPPIAVAAWRVRAVIPYHDRVQEVRLLLEDLAAQRPDGRIRLSVLAVDNASRAAEPLAAPEGLDFRRVRLDTNTGGSGGFNRGLRAWLGEGVAGDAHELLWLLDSDVRLDAGALGALLDALDRYPELAGVGSALADPETREVFEAGGEVDPRTGELVQALPADWKSRRVIPAGYVAACSLLIRRRAVEAAGVMSELFVSGDDVEWCARVRSVTGLGFAAVPGSIAYHPRPDKMRTWGRYYAARNAFTVMDAAGITGRMARFRRAIREVGRAAGQVMVGRDDLAALHLKGMRDAGKRGPSGPGVIEFEPWLPMSELHEAVRTAVKARRGRLLVQRGVVSDLPGLLRALNAICIAPDIEESSAMRPGALGLVSRVLARLLKSPRYGVAVVSARGRPDDWLAGRVVISVDERAGGFAVRKIRRLERAWRLMSVIVAGLSAGVRVAARKSRETQTSGTPSEPAAGRRPTLSIIVLSFNRWPVLEQTLRRLAENADTRGAEIIVVDNASADGTVGKLAAKFPEARVVPQRQNVGVAAFNEGVRQSSGDAVLILDDDSWPESGVIDAAIELLSRRPDIAAVSLHPRHSRTGRSEWGFAGGAGATERWPVMGCGNLVRRTAWDRVGGYERKFFLYRNDVDLALKLLGSGHKVYFDPAWVVWHDTESGAGGTKSTRWFELASRNWVWLCRRHGAGWTRLKAMAAGWLWAHRLAGWSVSNHLAVLKGIAAGVWRRNPTLPLGTRRGALTEFLRVRLSRSAQ